VLRVSTDDTKFDSQQMENSKRTAQVLANADSFTDAAPIETRNALRDVDQEAANNVGHDHLQGSGTAHTPMTKRNEREHRFIIDPSGQAKLMHGVDSTNLRCIMKQCIKETEKEQLM
jgi:hypothetical protein